LFSRLILNARPSCWSEAIKRARVRVSEKQRESGYTSQASTDYVRPENLRAAANLRSEFRNLTMEQLAEQAETMPMGTADEVAQRDVRVDQVQAPGRIG